MKPGLVRALLGAAGVLAVGAGAVAASGGGAIEAGPLILRSHNPLRPAAAAIVLAICALAGGRGAVSDALGWWWTLIERHAAAASVAAAAAAAAAGIVWGTFVAGGSDSYCYINQAELFARGEVRLFDPLAADPAWPGNAVAFAPAGHNPASGEPGYYVPICPAGYPLLLAPVRFVLGRTAMFWVTPLLGGVTVLLAFVLGRRVAGPAAGLLAALLTASSPIFLYQIVQPMNDVPATAAWAAAIVAAFQKQPGRTRALMAGVLAGLAITIRPNLVPLAGIVGLGAALVAEARPRADRFVLAVAFAAGAVPGVALVMILQSAIYGSPLSSGYGDLSALFSVSNIVPNLRRYPVWLVAVHTPLVAAAAVAPFVLRPGVGRQAVWLLAFAAGLFALYLPYVVFDAWWYLRFILPAIPLLLALSSGVVVEVVNRTPVSLRAIVFVGIASSLTLAYLSTAARRDVFRLEAFESRFRSAGEYVATLPANAVLITSHHTGSVRFYSGRPSIGWREIEPGRLDEVIAYCRSKGLKPYLLLEDWEVPNFTQQFSRDRLGGLDWPAIAEIDRVVRIYDPEDHERRAYGSKR